MPWYVGADGGGTKTAYALFDANGALQSLLEGPGSNHENLEGGFDEAAGLIFAGVQNLLAVAGKGLDDVDFIFMGLAGLDHPSQHDAMRARLQALGLRRLELCNDGFLPVKAGSATGAAIGLNLGTGTVCNAIDRQGRQVQLAGLGDLSGDVGNGEWIFAQACRLLYDDTVLHIEHTKLAALACEAFGFLQPGAMMQQLADPTPEDVRTLIDLFWAAVNAGDAPALRMVAQMALRGAQLIAAHVRNLDFGAVVEVVLSGSIHTKLPNQIYLDLLRQQAEALTGRTLTLHKLEAPPVTGCMRFIKEIEGKST
ncbi:MAG: hypothetical protein LBB50_05155 [Oscillospiraceae bacterium]|jgi:N-acetylglucosamine kinase-like BadF-type ATPase|nr:hypothetical protein [Oscillospiraceae bacterium]